MTERDAHDFPLFRKLRREHRARQWMLPCGAALAVTGLSLALQGLLLPLLFRKNPAVLCGAQSGTALFLTVAAFGLAAWLFLRRRRRTAETAAELDAEADAKNRLEAAWELRNADHVLKEEILKDAAEAYRPFRFSRRPAGLKLILGGLAAVLIGNLLILAESRSAAQRAAAGQPGPLPGNALPAPQTGENGAHEERRAEPDTPSAELALSHPEPELRARPLDEIEWEGQGSSRDGFSEIVLTVFVNGGRKTEWKPGELPAAKGEIRFGGFLPLEELDVKPFDLVSYHLTGIVDSGGKRTEILSTPQFIEIRPFREEAQLRNLPGGGGDAFQMLNLFLGIQIDLNKALFRAEIMRRRGGGDAVEFRNALRELEREQKELSADLEKYLNSEEARNIPADAVNHLEKSLESMEKTTSALREILP